MRVRPLLCAALLLAAACQHRRGGPGGDATAGGEGYAGNLDPMTLILPGTVGVTQADVRALRGTPYYDMLMRLVAEQAPLRETSRRMLRDVLGHADHVVAGLVPAGADFEAAPVVVNGVLQPAELEAIFRREAGGSLRIEEAGDRRIFTTADLFGIALTDGTWVLGPTTRFQEVWARLDQPSPPALYEPLIEMMERVRFDEGPLTVALMLNQQDRDRIAETLPEFPDTARSSLAVFGARLDLTGQFALTAVGDMGDEARAAQVSRESRELLGGGARNFLLLAMGFGPLFRGAVVNPEGRNAVLTVQMSEADALSLLERVSGMLELAAAARDEEEEQY